LSALLVVPKKIGLSGLPCCYVYVT